MPVVIGSNIYIYIYIYIYIEVDKRVSLQRCNAFFAAALLCWQKYIQFIFCCSAAISLAGDNYQCHITGRLIRRNYYQIAAAQWRMVHFGTQGSVLSRPQILDPSMKDWYQYRPWNLTHRAQLRESGHMTYHTTALLPNSSGPMADGRFWDPKGRSYPHPKYWTHRWRIDINIDHGISPIEPS